MSCGCGGFVYWRILQRLVLKPHPLDGEGWARRKIRLAHLPRLCGFLRMSPGKGRGRLGGRRPIPPRFNLGQPLPQKGKHRTPPGLRGAGGHGVVFYTPYEVYTLKRYFRTETQLRAGRFAALPFSFVLYTVSRRLFRRWSCDVGGSVFCLISHNLANWAHFAFFA